MRLQLIKTTTDPRSSCRNNARMNCSTPRFILVDEDGYEMFTSRKKADCQEILDWVEDGNWDGEGELELAFDSRINRIAPATR